MAINMNQIDAFIETSINRMAGENGPMQSNFYIDLRESNPDRQRITQALVQKDIELCERRGVHAERQGDGLKVTVDLNSCFLNSKQTDLYNTALNYKREVHGEAL